MGGQRHGTQHETSDGSPVYSRRFSSCSRAQAVSSLPLFLVPKSADSNDFMLDRAALQAPASGLRHPKCIFKFRRPLIAATCSKTSGELQSRMSRISSDSNDLNSLRLSR